MCRTKIYKDEMRYDEEYTMYPHYYERHWCNEEEIKKSIILIRKHLLNICIDLYQLQIYGARLYVPTELFNRMENKRYFTMDVLEDPEREDDLKVTVKSGMSTVPPYLIRDDTVIQEIVDGEWVDHRKER